jgi:hypothetical protein
MDSVMNTFKCFVTAADHVWPTFSVNTMCAVTTTKLSSDKWIYFLPFLYEMLFTKWPKHRTCNIIKESERIALFFLSVRLNTEISGYLRAPAAFGPQYSYLRSLGVPQTRSKYRLEEKNLCPRQQSKASSIPQKIFLPVPTELIRKMKYN